MFIVDGPVGVFEALVLSVHGDPDLAVTGLELRRRLDQELHVSPALGIDF